MNKIYLFLLFLLVQRNLYSENYAIFIPDNKKTNIYQSDDLPYEDRAIRFLKPTLSSIFGYDIELELSDIVFRYDLNVFTIKSCKHDFCFYQEKKGKFCGRRQLFKNLHLFDKVFVFENENKFKTYRAYRNYEEDCDDLLKEQKSLGLLYESYRTGFIGVGIKPNVGLKKKIERDYFRSKRYYKRLRNKFKFIRLGLRTALFLPSSYKEKVYKYDEKNSTFILSLNLIEELKPKVFETEESLSPLPEVTPRLFFTLQEDGFEDLDYDTLPTKLFNILIDNPDQSIYYYQERKGDDFGRRRLIKDIAQSPYDFYIYCFEEKERFMQKMPKSIQGSFEIRYCDI